MNKLILITALMLLSSCATIYTHKAETSVLERRDCVSICINNDLAFLALDTDGYSCICEKY